ncbi:uncharacterized protein LOC109612910 [Musca domestica]|uniref:Uncharacterized protein LOC109612910 n=1 Tax=Musca domestica TaxID=7370 RepID=A0ABM3VQU0_MUSDO|nr:uncharacterized protein LOC109612910 [Musca domestica]
MSSSPSPPKKIKRVTLTPYSENIPTSNTNLNDVLKAIESIKKDTESLQNQFNVLQGQIKFVAEALAENKVLLTKILKETYEEIPVIQKFPIKSEEQLIEIDKEINAENRNQYIKAMRSMLEPAGVHKNLKCILNDNVTMAYNVDGVQGKKSFKQLKNFYGVLLEAVSMAKTNNIGPADDQIRKAIQLQKRRIFKNMSVQRHADQK